MTSGTTAVRSTGAILGELERAGERLRYCLLKGTGPAEGWISLKAGPEQRSSIYPELSCQISTWLTVSISGIIAFVCHSLICVHASHHASTFPQRTHAPLKAVEKDLCSTKQLQF